MLIYCAICGRVFNKLITFFEIYNIEIYNTICIMKRYQRSQVSKEIKFILWKTKGEKYHKNPLKISTQMIAKYVFKGIMEHNIFYFYIFYLILVQVFIQFTPLKIFPGLIFFAKILQFVFI